MSPERVFALSNGLATLCWLALFCSPPAASWTPRVWFVCGRLVPALFGVVYLLLFVFFWRGEGGFGSVAEVRAGFEVTGVLVAGWLHYLAFDLFVGTWIASQASSARLPHLAVVPLLLLTFLLGPLGLLAFLVVRGIRGGAQT